MIPCIQFRISRLIVFGHSYLWPAYTDEASNFHVLLIALIANVKRREHLETWSELRVVS